MIETKKFVPKILADSRDYRVFLKLLDMIIVSIKNSTDDFVNLLNPDKCNHWMLPLLSSYVGYDYDHNVTFDANRIIIKEYPSLIRNRGSETGIKLAVSVAINSSGFYEDTNLLSLFSIHYDYKENKITIYMYINNFINKIKDLIEVVRPAGVRWEIVSALPIVSYDTISISDTVDLTSYSYVSGDINRLGEDKFMITYDSAGNITNINDNGFILDNDNNPTIYKIVNIEYKEIDGIPTNEVNRIMIKNTTTNNVIWGKTDRYSVSDKNRIGFGEVSNTKKG